MEHVLINCLTTDACVTLALLVVIVTKKLTSVYRIHATMALVLMISWHIVVLAILDLLASCVALTLTNVLPLVPTVVQKGTALTP